MEDPSSPEATLRRPQADLARPIGTRANRCQPRRRRVLVALGTGIGRAGVDGRAVIHPAPHPSYYSAMAKLTVLTQPDKTLRKISRLSERVHEEVRTLAEDML